MNILSLLLIFKILLTLGVIWTYGFSSTKRLNALSGQYGDSPLTYRLYAVALSALVVGYGFALLDALSGHLNFGTLAAGVVSNLGASVMLHAWACHPKLRLPAWIFAGVGIAFLLALIFPGYALLPLTATDG